MNKDVIIALDFPTKDETLAFLDQFQGRKPFVKIGMELFYAEGPAIIREIKARGHKIFLEPSGCGYGQRPRRRRVRHDERSVGGPDPC